MFELQSDEARLLLNVAMMATGQNRFQSAAKILAALERFRPHNEQLAIAKTVLMISMQEFAMAVDFIDREALADHPESAMLKTFRGMALIRMGRRDDALQCLGEAAVSDDESAANLAKGLING